MDISYLDSLQQFVLAGEAKDLRQELYEIMTMTVLCKYGGTIKSLDQNQIIDYVGKHFHLKDVPDIHISNALKNLEDNGLIRVMGKIFTIPDEQCSILDSETKKTKQIESKVKLDLQEKIKENLKGVKEETSDQIIDNFFDTLVKTLENYGAYAARLFYTDPDNTEALSEFDGFGQLFKKHVLKIIPPQYHEKLSNLISEFFFNPTKELSQYLYSISVAYTFTKILNADPNLQKISSQSWLNKEIIIDTNLIIDLLFRTSDLHQSIKTILTKTKNLGIKIFVLEETISEFQSWLYSIKEQHQFVEKGSSAKLDPNLFKNDLFLNEFYNERISNKLITINDFASSFENTEFLLKNNFDIETIPSNIKPKDIDEELLGSIKKASQFGGKNKNAQIHDAIALEFVRQRRESQKIDESGPSIWFLTEDNTLNRSEKSFYGKKTSPNSVANEIWLQIIMPFISPKFDEITATAFSKTLSSNFIIRKITTKNIIKILSTVWASKGLKEEQIKKIISDKHISKCFENLDKASETNDESKIQKELSNITKLMDKKYLERIKNLEVSVKQLKNNALEKKKQHKKEKTEIKLTHEKESNKKFLKYLVITSAIGIGIFYATLFGIYPLWVDQSIEDGLITTILFIDNQGDGYLITDGKIINSAREKHVIPDDPLIYSLSIENQLEVDRKIKYSLQIFKGGEEKDEVNGFWDVGPNETMIREIPFFLHENGVYRIKFALIFDTNRDNEELRELGFKNYQKDEIQISNFEVISSANILQRESNEIQYGLLFLTVLSLIIAILMIQNYKKG